MTEQLIMTTRTTQHGDPEAEWVTATIQDGILTLELDDGETIALPAGEVFALFAPPRSETRRAAA